MAVAGNLKFTNRTAQRVAVYWINFQGKPVRYAAVEPNRSVVLSTHQGHRWAVQGASGRWLRVVVAPAKDSEVVVGPAGNQPAAQRQTTRPQTTRPQTTN